MAKIYNFLLLVAFVAAASALPYQYQPEEAYYAVPAYQTYRLRRSIQPVEDFYNIYAPEEADHDIEDAIYTPEDYESHRYRRSLQAGGPQIPGQTPGWSVSPNVERDEKGNTKTTLGVQHVGTNHDFNAGWEKVVRGPNKAKPTWHAGGNIRW